MSEKSKIQPLGKRVLVQPDEVEQVTAGGLVLPPSTSENERPETGVIITLGKGKMEGKDLEFDVKVGDKVLFNKYKSEKIEVDGKKYLLLDADDILATIK